MKGKGRERGRACPDSARTHAPSFFPSSPPSFFPPVQEARDFASSPESSPAPLPPPRLPDQSVEKMAKMASPGGSLSLGNKRAAPAAPGLVNGKEFLILVAGVFVAYIIFVALRPCLRSLQRYIRCGFPLLFGLGCVGREGRERRGRIGGSSPGGRTRRR